MTSLRRSPVVLVVLAVLLLSASAACASQKPASAVPAVPNASNGEGAPEGGGPIGEALSEQTGTASPAETGDALADGPKRKRKPAKEHRFKVQPSKTARKAHGVKPSTLKPSKTHAVLKFFVVDKEKGPIEGIVTVLKEPSGKQYYAPETDAVGYTELRVPVGKTYKLVYLSLGRRDIAASVPIGDEPNQTLKLTLRYKRYNKPSKTVAVVLSGVEFDTGKAELRPESEHRLDRVLEYLTHKPKVRIQISGHTDNVGKPARNKALSQRRAEACRDYLVKGGIGKARVEAVGYGDERPVAPNDTPEGRQRNRRIEAKEL